MFYKEGLSMVQIKAVKLITDEGFNVYDKSFNSDDKEWKIISKAIDIAIDVHLSPLFIGTIKFKSGWHIFKERGRKIITIAIVCIDPENFLSETNEYRVRGCLLLLTKEVEKLYAGELINPSQLTRFEGITSLVKSFLSPFLNS